MRIIFLDIDGVLNHNKTRTRLPQGFLGIDPECVERLNDLVARANQIDQTEVVLSSTWRLIFKPGPTLKHMRDQGYIGPDFLGITPDLYGKERGHEIQLWLNNNSRRHGVNSFVILDDTSDMVHLTPRFIQTGWTTGLSKNDVEKALDVLRKTYPVGEGLLT